MCNSYCTQLNSSPSVQLDPRYMEFGCFYSFFCFDVLVFFKIIQTFKYVLRGVMLNF